MASIPLNQMDDFLLANTPYYEKSFRQAHADYVMLIGKDWRSW